MHQVVERQMVNDLVANGWHAFSLHTDSKKPLRNIPYRHGVTVLTRFVSFDNGIRKADVPVREQKSKKRIVMGLRKLLCRLALVKS